jgi:hypothetical protein
MVEAGKKGAMLVLWQPHPNYSNKPLSWRNVLRP